MIVNIKEEWIKPIINIAFFLFLSALTIYGLVHITNNIFLRIIIGVIAFLLDAYMLFCLSKAKYLWKTGLTKDRWMAVKYFLVYTVYTVIYVFLFAIGFYLAELKTNTEIAKINQQIQTLQFGQVEIQQIQAKALAQGLTKEVETTYGKKSVSLDQNITKLTEDNTKLIKTLQKNSKRNAENSHNFIQSLVDTFTWDLNSLLAVLFGVLVILMQFCLIDSSFSIAIDDKEKIKELDEFKKKLLIFLNALFEGRNKNGAVKDIPVNGIRTISELTKMSEEECLGYRNYLERLKVNGGYAIAVTQGGTTSNYSQKFIHDYIVNH